jgi:hypothetical protein
MTATTLPPFQSDAMTPAKRAAVSYLARYCGHAHVLYAYQLRRLFGWCETNGLDPLVGIQRAHIELYVRYLGRVTDCCFGSRCGLDRRSTDRLAQGA